MKLTTEDFITLVMISADVYSNTAMVLARAMDMTANEFHALSASAKKEAVAAAKLKLNMK